MKENLGDKKNPRYRAILINRTKLIWMKALQMRIFIGKNYMMQQNKEIFAILGASSNMSLNNTINNVMITIIVMKVYP